ncbi:hypothetical protein BDZ89DRAFT_1061944 [Hymenopellis radicata]|nr:hypothetical protein BDZ89DRAFT_1061944 [Hymenopellis radicata]
MATTAPAASNPRWTEPSAGSAFGGGRGGRRGGGGGRRGGRNRGSARKASGEASADTPSGSTAAKEKEKAKEPPKEDASSSSKKEEPKQAEVKKEEPKKEEKPTLEARLTDKKRGSKPANTISTPAPTPAPPPGPPPATTTPKEKARPSRRRSAQPVAQPTAPAPPVINTSVPKINIAATSSPTSSKKRRAGRPSPLKPSSSQSSLLAPHTAPLPPAAAKGLGLQPPNSARADIDAFVERVRASVISNEGRPSTPGSHIDWAGDDEDDGLPDLDDWGVTSMKDASQEVEMISPIIVDGLKLTPLPDLQPIPHTEGELSATSSPKLPIHPSLPAKPQGATPVLAHSRREKGAGIRPAGRGGKNSNANSRNPTAPPSPNPTPKYLNINGNGPPPPRNPSPHPRPPPSPRFQNLMPHPHSPNPYAQPAPFVHPYSRAHTPLQQPPANDGLGASIHAPKPADGGEITFASISGSFTDHTHTTPTPPFKELDESVNKKDESSIGGGETAFDRHLLSATHGRAHSTGRPFFGNPRFREGRGGNFNGGGRGFDKFGNGNGHANGFGQGSVNGNGNAHARTQSAPLRRPVITGDAISKLARTINGAKPVAAKEG